MTAWKPARRWIGAGPPTDVDRKVRVAFDLLSAAVTTSNLEYQLALAGESQATARKHFEKGEAFEVTVAHEWARLINTHSSFDGMVARREVDFWRTDAGRIVHADLVIEERSGAASHEPVMVIELKIGRDRNWTEAALLGDAIKQEHLVLNDSNKTPLQTRRFVVVVITPAKELTGLPQLLTLAKDPSLHWPDISATKPRTQTVRAGWKPRVLAIFPRFTPSPESASGWKSHEWEMSALIAYEYLP